MKIITIYSKLKDIYTHLAYEKFLFRDYSKKDIILFLWKNTDSVVIGKNQNPLLEVNLKYLKDNKILLARRFSGGGAVFHDEGNLNFSFIIPKNYYNYNQQMDGIKYLIQEEEKEIKLGSKHELLLRGFKFSGNAFAYSKDFILHHGTLLISSDLTKLRESLKSPVLDFIFDKRSIRSNRNKVINLLDADTKLSLSFFLKKIPSVFSKLYKKDYLFYDDFFDKRISKEEKEKINSYKKELKSKEWIFGKTPEFEIKKEIDDIKSSFIWKINAGYIKEFKIDSVKKDQENPEKNLKIKEEENLLKKIFQKESFPFKENKMTYKLKNHISLKKYFKEINIFLKKFVI